VAASHHVCIAVAICSVSAGERLCALRLHHGTYYMVHMYMMQGRAPEREILRSRRSFDCPRDAAWRRADCNSPIGRAMLAASRTRARSTLDGHQTTGRRRTNHAALGALVRCLCRSANPPVRHQSTGETRRMAAQERPCPTSGGGPVPLAAIQTPDRRRRRRRCRCRRRRGRRRVTAKRGHRDHISAACFRNVSASLLCRFASTTRETPGRSPSVSAHLI
jgi:hypothetical protein